MVIAKVYFTSNGNVGKVSFQIMKGAKGDLLEMRY